MTNEEFKAVRASIAELHAADIRRAELIDTLNDTAKTTLESVNKLLLDTSELHATAKIHSQEIASFHETAKHHRIEIESLHASCDQLHAADIKRGELIDMLNETAKTTLESVNKLFLLSQTHHHRLKSLEDDSRL